MSAGWTESMRQAWRGDCIGAGCPCCDPPRIGGAVSHTVIRRASRPYVCQSCAAPIAKGERYERTDGIANGRAWHWIQCEDSEACSARTEARDAQAMADLLASPLSPTVPREGWPDGIDF